MGSILNKLIDFGLIYEMKDWKQHFIQGTKGMPKTEEPILKYVENILKKSFDGAEERVFNNPLAPWLVMCVKQIGPQNINTAKIAQIKTVIDYFKTSGNAAFVTAKRKADGEFEVTTLENAAAYAQNKLDVIKKKEEEKAAANQEEIPGTNNKNKSNGSDQTNDGPEIIEDKIPVLKDVEAGRIQIVWKCNDGSGRVWVKVKDNTWLNEKCPATYVHGRTWGVECQGRNYVGGQYENYDLIGPPRGLTKGPYATIAGMAVLKKDNAITELLQEGNKDLGSQSTSGGWDDADEQFINFLCYSPELKSIQKLGGRGLGIIESIGKGKTDLFDVIYQNRPDIFESHKSSFLSILGKDWFIAREVNIDELAATNPIQFLKNFAVYLKVFGRKVYDLLKVIDIETISRKNSELVLDSMGYLIGNISDELFDRLAKNINWDQYIINKTESFKVLVKNMANLSRYRNFFKTLVFDKSPLVIQSFGGQTKGVYSFLKYAQEPRLPQHQNAKFNPSTNEYIGKRQIIVNPEAPFDQRIMRDQEFIIPDDLKMLSQKNRREFIKHNEEIIKSFVKGDEKSKQITFLRLLLSESNDQDIDRTMNVEKQDFIKYYDEKFSSGEKKKINIGGEIIESSYLPGLFEFYSAINKNNPNYLQTSQTSLITQSKYDHGSGYDESKTRTLYYFPVKPEEAKQNMPKIIKYYYDQRKKDVSSLPEPKVTDINPNIKKAYEQEKQSREFKLRYDAVKDFMKIMEISGTPPEQLIEFYESTFKPNNATVANFFINNLSTFLDKDNVINALNRFKPFLQSINAEKSIEKVLDSISTVTYMVQPEDMVEYIDIEHFPEGIYPYVADVNFEPESKNFLHGMKYKVIDTKNAGNIENALILLFEGQAAGNDIPQERWMPCYMFKIKKSKIIPTLDGKSVVKNLNENSDSDKDALRQIIRNRINKVATKSQEEKKKRISYTGIVLDNKSKERLADFIKEMRKAKKINIPDNWEFSADHITLNMGPSRNPELLGKSIISKVLTYAYNDHILAVGVRPDIEVEYEKENPHITIAFNKGGKIMRNNKEVEVRPVMSNELQTWKPVPKSFMISGIVKEVWEEITNKA